jgi:beta-xylosidase
MPAGKSVVLVGTLGRNAWIDRLVKEGNLDVAGIAGKWETFLIQVVDRPFPGVDQALVIAGSDRRGTVYGMFDLSSRIGVSPWVWWADVPPKRESHLYVLPGRHSGGEPKVKYRGIFINDEAPALAGWAREKFGGFNSRFYEHVFELLLRLKGNYLWPAMWGSAFADDDPESPRLADEYGIVMGTSHHEPMMRAHDEWRRYGSGKWNYDVNESALKEFWRQGIERAGSKESIVTIGMRGDGDEPMSANANVALLERIVRDQREILAQVTGRDPASIPQVWALYKEVQEYYDRGMRVPDDVTLLLCDDNWGNLRKLPDPAKSRAGGYGIYYHFDYVGGPRNYKWLNTVQIARVWEQMHLAYEYGARQIWIVNVGDIKPLEFPTQFFLEYAWNPDLWSAGDLSEYTRQWAAQQFGPRHAREIARILTAYTTFNSRRKPELLSPDTYSLLNYREAERVVEEYNGLAREADSLYRLLPEEQKDAYYQLILHPVLACANLHELLVTVGLNRLYGRQGRASANMLAARARELFARDSALSARYNHVMAGGKWNHMMDQTHISYTTWQQPDKDVMPDVMTLTLPERPELGVAVEGSAGTWPGDTASAWLPEFDTYSRRSHYLEIFNKGRIPFRFSAHASEPWVVLSRDEGEIKTESRIFVSIDWEKAPAGKHSFRITVSGGGRTCEVSATVNNPSAPTRDEVEGYVESGGCVAIEAGHFARSVEANGISWLQIPDLGRTLSGMTAVPVTAAASIPGGSSPRLEYSAYVFSAREVTVRAYLSPTLDFRADAKPGSGLRYGVSFDDEEPVIVDMHRGDTVADWKYPRWWTESVGNNMRITSSRHLLRSPGAHVLKFWRVDPGVVLQRLVIETGPVAPSYLGPPESRCGRKETGCTYNNPLLPGFYPDPSICRVGGDYYLVTSTFAYFPGIPVFHSRDLVHWELLGHVMDRPEQLNLDGQGVSRGLFAPTIRHNKGTFYVTCTLVDIGGNFVVTADSPRGPWSRPIWLPDVHGIDPSLFFDADGKAYLLYNGAAPDDRPLYNGHRTIRMREFDAARLRTVGEEKILVNGGTDISKKPIWIEGPHIFKKEGFYYLLAAEGGTGDEHSEVVFRSRLVTGPYHPFEQNPILTQRHLDPRREDPITSTGHADLVETSSGEWWAVFLGCRPYRPFEEGCYNTGRETFLAPVRWTEGWPRITEGNEEVRYSYPCPSESQSAQIARTGGTFRDEFSGRTLDRQWMFLRTPHERWYRLGAKKGFLAVSLRAEMCGGRMNPAFLGHRQQHMRGSASTGLRFSPAAENEKAGLLIFQNETHFYYLCKSVAGKDPVIQLFRSTESAQVNGMELMATRPLPGEPGEIFFKIEADGGEYSFLYGFSPGTWEVLKEGEDARYLSTRVAGGFVGCTYALYATSLGRPARSVAYYDWFEYSGDDGP